MPTPIEQTAFAAFFAFCLLAALAIQLIEDYEASLMVIPDVTFSLDAFDDATCMALLRFSRAEIRELLVRMQLPKVFYTRDLDRAPMEEAFCMLLMRLAFPGRLVNLVAYFGRSVPACSRICNGMVALLHERFVDLIRMSPRLYTRDRLSEYANAISVKLNVAVPVCGFIDGSHTAIARPIRHQRAFFSGHKRCHTLNWPRASALAIVAVTAGDVGAVGGFSISSRNA